MAENSNSQVCQNVFTRQLETFVNEKVHSVTGRECVKEIEKVLKRKRKQWRKVCHKGNLSTGCSQAVICKSFPPELLSIMEDRSERYENKIEELIATRRRMREKTKEIEEEKLTNKLQKMYTTQSVIQSNIPVTICDNIQQDNDEHDKTIQELIDMLSDAIKESKTLKQLHKIKLNVTPQSLLTRALPVPMETECNIGHSTEDENSFKVQTNSNKSQSSVVMATDNMSISLTASEDDDVDLKHIVDYITTLTSSHHYGFHINK